MRESQLGRDKLIPSRERMKLRVFEVQAESTEPESSVLSFD